MNRLPIVGERIVYIGKSKAIQTDFKGYDIIEVGNIYTVERIISTVPYEEADTIDNCAIALIGLRGYGYATDCFVYLEDYRISKLNELLD